MHLQPEEFIDLAEGARAEASAPHLLACGACRQQLAELRAMMSAAADGHVPEPSPLFWDHFSARVHEAIAADGPPSAGWTLSWAWPRLLPIGVGALAIALLSLTLNRGRVEPERSPIAPQVAVSQAGEPLLDPPGGNDDSSLVLVAELTPDLDFDTAREAGLGAADTAEHAVTHMTGGELRELRRLLQEELAHSGA